jgi:hypothetical protein
MQQLQEQRNNHQYTIMAYFSQLWISCVVDEIIEFSSDFFSLKRVFINNMFLGIEIYYINI